MMTRWITGAGIVILAVYYVVKLVRDMRHLTKVKIPHQLVELVQQAHQNESFRTQFDIKVSEQMRDALCAPLAPEQLAVIRAAQKGTYSTHVKCELLSSTYKGAELSGVVKVAVRVSSKFSERPLVCPETKLKITVRSSDKPGIASRWEVASVEQIA